MGEFCSTTLENALFTIASLRDHLEALKADQQKMLDTVRQSTAYIANQERIELEEKALSTYENRARELALEAYASTGDKHPHPSVSIKVMNRIQYDLNEATVWARENLPEAIHLDPRFFEKHARAVLATKPIPCVTFIPEPTAQIASDLSDLA